MAKEDYSLSKGIKILVASTIVLAAVVTNIISSGWSPVALSTHLVGGIATTVVLGLMNAAVFVYMSISIWEKTRENERIRRAKEKAEKARAIREEKQKAMDERGARI